MSIKRRDFIIGSLGVAATANLLPGCGDDDDSGHAGNLDGGMGLDGGLDSGMAADASVFDAVTFAHGVGSADPLATAVLIWTRVSGQTQPLAVNWTFAKDAALKDVVQTGTVQAVPTSDFTVQVDVTGLSAGTTYYYAFSTGATARSITGRTRTLPSTLDHARIAFTSCANWQNGYFSAYRAISKRNDLDVWIHLGDYIYEYADGVYADATLAQARAHLPANEAISLTDYRTRYAQYRSDPDLQELHRQHPLIVVWDDHEFANNAWVGGAENHNPGEGDWNARKAAAIQAFREWLPIRVIEASPTPKIFRSFPFGELFDLIMLDTRMYARDKQTGMTDALGDVGTDPAVWADPNRHIIGAEQEAWLFGQLDQSVQRGARWRLLGNQVVFSQGRNPLDTMNPHGIIYSDFWDDYQADRNALIQHIATNGVHNVVFLTGDIHSTWVMEVSTDPFNPAVYNPSQGLNGVAVELVGPAVTSLALEDNMATAQSAPALLASANPHILFSEFTRKGYVLLDITEDRLQAEWWYVKQFKLPNSADEELGKAYTCQQSVARLVETTTITPPKAAPGAVA